MLCERIEVNRKGGDFVLVDDEVEDIGEGVEICLLSSS